MIGVIRRVTTSTRMELRTRRTKTESLELGVAIMQLEMDAVGALARIEVPGFETIRGRSSIIHNILHGTRIFFPKKRNAQVATTKLEVDDLMRVLTKFHMPTTNDNYVN